MSKLIVTLSLALALGIGTWPAAAQAPQNATKQFFPGVENYTRVDATIACGGATAPSAMSALVQDGFASVINLRLAGEPGANVEAEKDAATQAGLKYIHLPLNGASPDPAVIDSFLAAVTEPANQPVFIHCATANRVAAVWLVKRVMVDGWTVEGATTEARTIGLTSDKLKQFALDYLHGHGK